MLVTVCVGEVGGVSWLRVSFLFARGDGGGVVMFLFLVWICFVIVDCALGGMLWWEIGGVGVICVSRNFVIARLPPCSLRMSVAL